MANTCSDILARGRLAPGTQPRHPTGGQGELAMAHRRRPTAEPFVVDGPSGARIRTRLRISPEDEAVLMALGAHLGSLVGRDLAKRCRQGRLDARQQGASRAERKRAATKESSSRWAGAITRTSEDAWQTGRRNLGARAASLQARIAAIQQRLGVGVGSRRGRIRGYASGSERFDKQRRLQALQTQLTQVQARLAAPGCRSAGVGGWKLPRVATPPIEELRGRGVLAVDLNHGQLAAVVLDRSGNPVGTPLTIPLEVVGLPATTRDGHLREAISQLLANARKSGCSAIAIEDLDFAQARSE